MHGCVRWIVVLRVYIERMVVNDKCAYPVSLCAYACVGACQRTNERSNGVCAFRFEYCRTHWRGATLVLSLQFTLIQNTRTQFAHRIQDPSNPKSRHISTVRTFSFEHSAIHLEHVIKYPHGTFVRLEHAQWLFTLLIPSSLTTFTFYNYEFIEQTNDSGCCIHGKEVIFTELPNGWDCSFES